MNYKNHTNATYRVIIISVWDENKRFTFLYSVVEQEPKKHKD